ncbi:MAG: cobalt transport protein [Clostridia bacterium]|nr:cobalt transport protein [Clostridia bacterium]
MIKLSELHPIVAGVYFLSVLLTAMFSSHPALLLTALVGGMAFFFKTAPRTSHTKELCFYFLLFLLVSLSNPLFSHRGVTPLFYLNNNPITLEAFLCGIGLGVMILAVIFWFKCLSAVMTEDKILWIFAKISPKLALLLSSSLRFIPMLKTRSEKIREAQKALGSFSADNWLTKLRLTLCVYSALITWALESAVETGASMKARGYGLKGRTNYSLYRFRLADAFALAMIAVLSIVTLSAVASGALSFEYYPAVTISAQSLHGTLALISFGALCFLPFILEVKEDLKWKFYRSRI